MLYCPQVDNTHSYNLHYRAATLTNLQTTVCTATINAKIAKLMRKFPMIIQNLLEMSCEEMCLSHGTRKWDHNSSYYFSISHSL